MSLQKVVVIPFDIYNSLKSTIFTDVDSSEFDKDMKLILHDKKLTDLEKWELYREKLIHFGENVRASGYKTDHQILPKLIHVESVGSQTKYLSKKDNETSTDSKTLSVGITQTPLVNSQIIPPLEQVFETTNSFHSLQDGVEEPEISNDFNFRNISSARKLSSSNTVRKKLKSKHHDIDLYEMENGDVVTVVKSAHGDISKKDESFRTNAFSPTSFETNVNKRRGKKKTSTPLKGIHWEHL